LEIYIRNTRSNRPNITKRAYKRKLQQDFDAEDDIVIGGSDKEIQRLLSWMKSVPIRTPTDLAEVEKAMEKTYDYRKALIHGKNRPSLTDVLSEFPKLKEKSYLVSFCYHNYLISNY
jgi:hypothetical protein